MSGVEKKDLSTSGLLASADLEVRTLTVDPRLLSTSTQGVTRDAAAAGNGSNSELTIINVKIN